MNGVYIAIKYIYNDKKIIPLSAKKGMARHRRLPLLTLIWHSRVLSKVYYRRHDKTTNNTIFQKHDDL